MIENCLNSDSLRPLRHPLRLCVKNSNAKTQRFYAKDAKKHQHEGTKTERHEVPSGLLRAIALAMTGNSLVSKSLVSKSLISQISKSQIFKNMNKVNILTVIAAIIICAASCGGQQPTGVTETADAPSQITEETITKDILSLPEMQFPNAAVMIVDEPTADQPYFTVKGGSDMDDHFATSFWFHVYTAPEYEIRLYDVVSDSEMTLEERRNGNPAYDEVWEDVEVSVIYEDLVFAKANGKTGIINSVSGEVVVPLIYDEFEHYFPVHDNHLIVVKDGKYGCIDFSGNTVLALIYDKLRFNVEDIWDFCIADKWGLVEPGDKIVIPAEYDDISEFKNDLAPVKRYGKWGFINRKNEMVVPFKYDKVSMSMFDTMYGEVAFVERDGEKFWIDENGNEYPHND